nr:UBP1-associated protein 2C-like [Tanacetum cinerariifolium]
MVRWRKAFKKIDGRITVFQLASARDVANNNVENRKSGRAKGFVFFVYKSEEGARKAVVDSVKSIDGHQVMCKIAVDGKKGRAGGGMMPSCGPVPGIVNTVKLNASFISVSYCRVGKGAIIPKVTPLPGLIRCDGRTSYSGYPDGPYMLPHQHPPPSGTRSGPGYVDGKKGRSSVGMTLPRGPSAL